MPAAHVASWTGVNGFGNRSLSGINTTGANWLCLVLALDSATAPTISDTINGSASGNTWTLVDGPDTQGSTDYLRCYVCENANVGTNHVITSTYASGYQALAATAYSGMNTSATADKQATGTGGSGTTLTSGTTATTAQADELLIGYGTVSTGSNSTFTAGSGYTMRSQAGDASTSAIVFLQAQVVSATGTYNAVATWGGTGGAWIENIATFKATSGGGGSTYNESVSEAASSSDARTGLVVALNSDSEAASSADSLAHTAIVGNGLSESGTAQDTGANTAILVTGVSEAAAASDALGDSGSSSYTDAVLEQAAASDAVAADGGRVSVVGGARLVFRVPALDRLVQQAEEIVEQIEALPDPPPALARTIAQKVTRVKKAARARPRDPRIAEQARELVAMLKELLAVLLARIARRRLH